jgi:hypothetical protein
MKLNDLGKLPKIIIAESKGFFKIVDQITENESVNDTYIDLDKQFKSGNIVRALYDLTLYIKYKDISQNERDNILLSNKELIIKFLLTKIFRNAVSVEDLLVVLERLGQHWPEIDIIRKSLNADKSLNEAGVGKIVKGVNTTPDIKPGEIRRQAAKMNFNTTNDGVPPIMKPNGTYETKAKKNLRVSKHSQVK